MVLRPSTWLINEHEDEHEQEHKDEQGHYNRSQDLPRASVTVDVVPALEQVGESVHVPKIVGVVVVDASLGHVETEP